MHFNINNLQKKEEDGKGDDGKIALKEFVKLCIISSGMIIFNTKEGNGL